MEICVLTCRKATSLTRKIEEISSNLDLGSIKVTCQGNSSNLGAREGRVSKIDAFYV
jgi:hypothetical protein